MKLPALFLGEKSGEQLIASGDRGKLVGPDGKEIYWRAMECLNPNCPGRSDDKPFLFPEPDGISYIKPDGTIGHDVARLKTAAPSVGCPMCWPLRSRNETEQQRQQYANWVQPYVLPETAKRLAELDEEIKLRTELDKRKRHDAR